MLGARGVGFRFGVTATVLAVVLGVAALILLQVRASSYKMATDGALAIFAEVADRVGRQVEDRIGAARDRARIGASLVDPRVPVHRDGRGHPALAVLRTVLTTQANLYSAYVGYADGSFLQVIPVRGMDDILRARQAPAGTVEIVRAIAIEDGRRVQYWSFIDGDDALIAERREPDPDFDPRTRPWYGLALAAAGPVTTKPYYFNSVRAPGLTVSAAMDGAVHGVDFTLTELARLVGAARVSDNGSVVLFDADGRIIARPGPMDDREAQLGRTLAEATAPSLRVVERLRLDGMSGMTRTVDLDGEPHLGRLSAIEAADGALILAVVAPVGDFLTGVYAMAWWVVLSTALVIVVVMPPLFLAVGAMARDLTHLSEDAERVREMDFSMPPMRRSLVREFNHLAEAFSVMKSTILTRTRQLERSSQQLRRMVEVGVSMAAESDSGRLVESILLEAKSMAGAEGGILYIIEGERRGLQV
ncbi:MAG: cache domain-containing protein, partial [Pseudomonadota bacterium]